MNIEELITYTNIIIEEGLDSEDDIQSILKKWKTAYEKEKEERERIGKLYYETNENCIKYEKELEKEKEKNKELNRLKGFEMLDIFNMGKQSSRQRIEFDYVDKDKIKAILEEYKYTEIGDSEKIIEFYKKMQSLLGKE